MIASPVSNVVERKTQPLQFQRVTVSNLATVNGKPVVIIDMQGRVPTPIEVKSLATIVSEKGNGNVILTNADVADAALETAGLDRRVLVTNDSNAPTLARQAMLRRARLSAW